MQNPTQQECIVDLRGITRNFGSTRAVEGIDIAVKRGELFGLIGADGAGKSTLLRILTTLISPDAGDGTVLGYSLHSRRGAIRERVGWMSQKFSLYPDLSVVENLRFSADIHGISLRSRETAVERLLAFTRLGAAAGRRAGRLSGGMKQKLALAAALIHEPELLVLDEPTVGVDPVTRRDFWSLLGTLRAQGLTTVVSTPYMDEAARCDTLLLLHQGKTVGNGNPRQLTDSLEQSVAHFAFSAETALRWPVDKPAPSPFLRLYASGGEVIGVLPRATSLKEARAQATALFSTEVQVRESSPGVEDYLMSVLMQDNGTT